MATLDRSAFNTTLSVLALRVPKQQCGKFASALKPTLLKIPRVRPIVAADGDAASRLVLLSPDVSDVSELSEAAQQLVREHGATAVRHDVELTYEHLDVSSALRKLLPPTMEVPSSFQTVGHIAHLNLRDVQLPHKGVIGQVIMDKNSPRIRTVLTKVGSIATEYRTFSYELIAGVEDMEAECKENGCRFQLNFAQVYWNSRLEAEHRRLASSFQPGQVICDLMAGVGPFAMPAAKKGLRVLANDLNPASFKWLKVNAGLNKVQDKVRCFNLCGREFVQRVTAEGGWDGDSDAPFDVAVMNLPGSALEFLDAFVGLGNARSAGGWPEARLPLVHCYCFSRGAVGQVNGDTDAVKEAGFHDDILARAEAAMGARPAQYEIADVRDVAPGKRMFCLSFRLPKEIAYAEKSAAHEAEAEAGPDAKRSKTD